MWRCWSLVLIACGRVGFDGATADASAGGLGEAGAQDASAGFDAEPPCAADDAFESGLGGWQGAWTLQPGEGPDGSTAVGFSGTTQPLGELLFRPDLTGVSVASIDLDLRLDAPTSDFGVLLLKPGWTTHNSDGYEVALYPVGGDNPQDQITRNRALGKFDVDARAITLARMTWHHVRVTRSLNGAFAVELDGASYLSGTNTDHAPPFDLGFRIFNAAVIDNVRIGCAR